MSIATLIQSLRDCKARLIGALSTQVSVPEGAKLEDLAPLFDGYTPPTPYNDLTSNKDELVSLTIPEGVTKIGSYALYGSKKLTSLTIPKSVSVIGENALYAPRDSMLTITFADRTIYDGYPSENYPWGITSGGAKIVFEGDGTEFTV